jgi:hypothetical protein
MENKKSLGDYQKEYDALLKQKRIAKIKIKEEKLRLESLRKKKIYEVLDSLDSKQIDIIFTHVSSDNFNIGDTIESIVSLFPLPQN